MTINDLIFKAKSGLSGERLEMDNETIRSYDQAGNVRIKLGKLT